MSATASRPKVRPLDPLDLDGLLSDEDRLIAETVRRFATDRVLPHVEEWYEEGTLPTRDLAPAIGELGLQTHVTDTIMSDDAARARCAGEVLRIAGAA